MILTILCLEGRVYNYYTRRWRSFRISSSACSQSHVLGQSPAFAEASVRHRPYRPHCSGYGDPPYGSRWWRLLAGEDSPSSVPPRRDYEGSKPAPPNVYCLTGRFVWQGLMSLCIGLSADHRQHRKTVVRAEMLRKTRSKCNTAAVPCFNRWTIVLGLSEQGTRRWTACIQGPARRLKVARATPAKRWDREQHPGQPWRRSTGRWSPGRGR